MRNPLRTLVIIAAFAALLIIPALSFGQQCYNGQCAVTKPAQPAVLTARQYQLADSTGQAWQHADPNVLRDFVSRRNAGIANYPTPVVTPTPTPPGKTLPVTYSQPTDPYNFGAAINAVRAARGYRPLAYNPTSSYHAQLNSSRGMGHSVGGYSRGQCAAYGNPHSALNQWLSEGPNGPHYKIVMDAAATSYGIGASGNVVTLNVN